MGFVEAFGLGEAAAAEAAETESALSVLDPSVPFHLGLARLSAAQERATAEDLMALTAGYVHPRSAEFLMSDSRGESVI